MVILFCFSRAHLQGDLDLQSHCTEGFKEEKWDVIVATGAAVAGTQFLMTSNSFHTALLVAKFWPVGPFSMCQHKDDTVLWALDFVLLKGKHP